MIRPNCLGDVAPIRNQRIGEAFGYRQAHYGDHRSLPARRGHGEGERPGGLAGLRLGEAAGDLDGVGGLARRLGDQERVEPVAVVADDVPGGDLCGGRARP